MEIQFPSFADMADFNPDDPFDARAEAVRKRVVEGFATGDFTISPENAEATLAGLIVGVVGVAMAATHPDGHRDLTVAIIKYVPWAMNEARAMMGLPELRDN